MLEEANNAVDNGNYDLAHTLASQALALLHNSANAQVSGQSNGDGSNWLFGILPFVAGAVVLSALLFFLWRRGKKKPKR